MAKNQYFLSLEVLTSMKKTIDLHISQLLYKHECVIIPEFGAFITREHTAEINHATHMMRPPSRRVSFNKRITQNDGLLANFVSHAENISYNAALDGIAISVRSWSRMLKSGKKIILEGVGRLYLDDQGKIQFNPQIDLNYDRKYYGLSIFRAELISREIEIQKGIEKVISGTTKPARLSKQKSKTVNTKKRRRSLGWVAILGPVAALMIAGSFIQNSFEDGLNGYANINPFRSVKLFENKVNTVEKEAFPANSVHYTEVETSEPVEEIRESDISEAATESIKNEEVPVKGIETSKPFKIVVGSFKERENALEYVEELQAKGFDAFIAEGDARFNRVAVNHYASREEADEALVSIKQHVNTGAWVYKY